MDCSSVNSDKRPKFGSRLLTSSANVFKHNAWDNVEWSEEQEENAYKTTLYQLENAMSFEQQSKYLNQPSSFWDKFYNIHDNKFFKDRHWLFTEFPELLESTVEIMPADNNEGRDEYPGHDARIRYFEIGCGAGNTIFPLLKSKIDASFFMYGCDFAQSAVDVVKNNDNYNFRSL